MKVYVSGALYGEIDARFSIFDRGVNHGMTVCDWFFCFDGKFVNLEERLVQMRNRADAMGIHFPWSPGDLVQALIVTYEMNGLTGNNAILQLMVTDGEETLANISAGRENDGVETPQPLQISPAVGVRVFQPEAAAGLLTAPIAAATLVDFSYPGGIIDWERYFFCCGGRNLALQEARSRSAQEALIFDWEETLTGCCGGVLVTLKDKYVAVQNQDNPEVLLPVLHQIFKEMTLTIMDQDLKLRDVRAAQECFLLRASGEISPVIALDGEAVGNSLGKPGPQTIAIAGKFYEKLTQLARFPF